MDKIRAWLDGWMINWPKAERSGTVIQHDFCVFAEEGDIKGNQSCVWIV